MNSKEFHSYNAGPSITESEYVSESLESIGREPIAEPKSIHQTQAFEVNVAINPLIAACAPLLTLSTQLREQLTTPNLHKLHANLCNEIKAFEYKARSLNYRSTTILAARYFICALIDEIILTSTWGENSLWGKQNLLKTFQRETWGGKRFFVILERSCEDPKLYIDLLELGYLCLSLGYEGKYHNKPCGHYELSQLIDKLYYLIRDERGEFSKRLLISPPNKLKQKKSFHRLLLPWVAAIIVVVSLVVSYIPYRIHLDKLAEPIHKLLINMKSKNE